jgi:transposase
LVDTREEVILGMEVTEMAARKKYSEEFKQEAIRLLETRGDRTIADVAESLGIAPAVLYTWRGQQEAQSAERRERGETAEEELKRLRRELAQTRQERDLLKKSISFFVKNSR